MTYGKFWPFIILVENETIVYLHLWFEFGDMILIFAFGVQIWWKGFHFLNYVLGLRFKIDQVSGVVNESHKP